MIYEDSAEDKLWKTIDSEDIWIMDKLILSRKLGYNCGPVGIDVPNPGWYIVRPCVNALGLGLGAQKIYLEEDTTNLPYGHFWCEWFEGDHYSVDFLPSWGTKIMTVKGFKNPNTFTKWDKWIKVENKTEHEIPKILYPTILKYDTINLEYIGNKLIEVHLRRNEDFDGSISEFIPVWEGQDKTPPKGYQYKDYPDVHGRIGAFIK